MNLTEEQKALQLADALENGSTYDVGSSVAYGWIKNDPTDEAAAELRRLHSEVETLRNLAKVGRLVVGDHHAPNDCYSTGPMTGDPVTDLVACPSCSFVRLFDAAMGEKS